LGLDHREGVSRVFQASWYWWLILFAVVAGAAWLLFRIRARFRDHEDPAEDNHRLLMQLGEMHRQGGLSEEEFRSIKKQVDRTPRSFHAPEPGQGLPPCGCRYETGNVCKDADVGSAGDAGTLTKSESDPKDSQREPRSEGV
jgi:hypothetical protein